MAFRHGDPGGRMWTTAGTAGANLLAHWTSVQTPASWSVLAGGGRVVGSCLRMKPSSAAGVALVKTLDLQATWGVAFGFRCGGFPGVGGAQIASFIDAGQAQCSMVLQADGNLSMTRSGTVLGTSVFPLTLNAWNHIEWKATIHPSNGVGEIRINNVSRMGPLSGLNTRTTTRNFANQVSIGTVNASGGGLNWDYDDVVIWDSQTVDLNGFADIHDFIGDCGLEWLPADGNGATDDWAPSAGSNYQNVDDAEPDGDVTYNEDSTVGHLDLYTTANLPVNVTAVKSAAAVVLTRKTDVGSRGIQAVIRSASANAVHPIEEFPGTSYVYAFRAYGRDPNNGSPIAWTATTANAVQVGLKVSS